MIEWMNEWETEWTCIQHIKLYPVGGDTSFHAILTTHTNPRRRVAAGGQKSNRRSVWCVSEWSECVVTEGDYGWSDWSSADRRGAQISGLLLSYASFLGFQSFSCIFWNSLAKGIFIKNIYPLAISHLIKNKRVYAVLLSLRHRLLYYWTWTDSVAKVLRMRNRAVKKCNSKIKNVLLCILWYD